MLEVSPQPMAPSLKVNIWTYMTNWLLRGTPSTEWRSVSDIRSCVCVEYCFPNKVTPVASENLQQLCQAEGRAASSYSHFWPSGAICLAESEAEKGATLSVGLWDATSRNILTRLSHTYVWVQNSAAGSEINIGGIVVNGSTWGSKMQQTDE